MRYLLFLLAVCAFGQGSDINDDWSFLGRLNAAAASHTLPFRIATSDPATCTVGEFVYRSDLAVGSRLRECTTTNNWTTVATGGGSSSVAGRYSAALNFPAIPDFGCSDLTFTATGVTSAAPLAVSPPAALETGLVAAAWVSAADTVRVRLCNVSGATVDPASGTFAVRDMATLGYVLASASINFGVIPDGGCLASTYTLTGAATGDNVAASWPAALESGLMPFGFVSAANTVSVRLCNFSGAALDPASGSFAAAITR